MREGLVNKYLNFLQKVHINQIIVNITCFFIYLDRIIVSKVQL